MIPSQPAAIASITGIPSLPKVTTPREVVEARAVAFAFVMTASLGFAWIANLFAGYARVTHLNGAMELRAALVATLVTLVLGAVLERIGAVEIWGLVARALALAPVWSATLFFSFYTPQVSDIPVGLLLVLVPVLAVVGAGRVRDMAKSTPRRSCVALAGLALLWCVPLASEPVDVDDAPLVRVLVTSR
jgi:hypothetical protein